MKIIDNIIYNQYCQYTGELITYKKVTAWGDGAAMDDTKADGVVYVKPLDQVNFPGYYRRYFKGNPNGTFWGILPDYVPGTGAGTDMSARLAKALAYASSNTFEQTIDINSGNYKISADFAPTANNVLLRGVGKNRVRLYLSTGVTNGYHPVGVQVWGLEKIYFRIGTGNSTTAHAVYPSAAPNGTMRDVQIEGFYTGAAIRHGVDSWSCTYDNVQVNNITAGDSWWIREGNTNALILNNCTATNNTAGSAMSISQGSHITMNNFRLEGNTVRNFEFYANTGNNAGIRGLFINDLYYEEAALTSIPLFTIRHLGGVMSLRDVVISGGHARCGGTYFADLRGLINGSGSAVFQFKDITLTDVGTNGAFTWDAQIRGKIDTERPYDRATLTEQILTDPAMSNLGRVVVIERSSTGLEQQRQQVNLGIKNATNLQAGALFWTAPNMQFYDGTSDRSVQIKGGSYVIAADTTYTSTQISGGALIAVNAGAAAVNVVLPAFGTVETNTQVTVSKTDASVNPVNITVTAGGTIGGLATTILYQRFDSITAFYDGVAIRLVASNKVFDGTYGGIKTGSYTTVGKDEFIEVNAAAGAVAITLQKASTVAQGTIKYIRKQDSTNNAVSFVLDAADTTNATSLTNPLDFVILYRGGTTQWRVLASGNGTNTPKLSTINTAVLSTDIQTNAYMNTNYGASAIGDIITFTNMTDASANVAKVEKLTSTTWYSKIDYAKNS
jgi:hypothetical protein